MKNIDVFYSVGVNLARLTLLLIQIDFQSIIFNASEMLNTPVSSHHSLPTATNVLPQTSFTAKAPTVPTTGAADKENINPESGGDIQHVMTIEGDAENIVLSDATMEDVVLSEAAVNIVASNRKMHLTRLQSIQGIGSKDIEVRSLRILCV